MLIPEDRVLTRTCEVLKLAEQLYNVDLSDVHIRFDLRGCRAGVAGAFRDDNGELHTFYIRFNHDMLYRKAFDHVYSETIPHEVAHIVCFIRPELGKEHDAGWEKVCRALGGTAAVLHDEDVVFNKGYTYEYVTTTGALVRVSQRVHKGVTLGSVYGFRGQGIINETCAYSIVGENGKTLAVKQ